MAKVAIVTDSASDLPAETARAAGITVVPLEVSFGGERFRAGVDLSTRFYGSLSGAAQAGQLAAMEVIKAGL